MSDLQLIPADLQSMQPVKASPCFDAFHSPELVTVLRRCDQETVLTVTGNMDLSAQQRIQTALTGALAAARADEVELSIDLTGVAYADSSGFQVMVNTSRAARKAGTPLRFRVRPNGQVDRALRLSRLDSQMTIDRVPKIG